MRGYIYPKVAASLVLAACLTFQACGAGTLSKLHNTLNRTAKALNAAAKTNHNFYESGIYGPKGSEEAIRVRQKAATVIHDSNEALIKALELAKSLTPETFAQGKLAVLQTLAQAAANLHTGNRDIDLVLTGIATLINQAVVIIEAFKSADLRYVLPEIQKWEVA